VRGLIAAVTLALGIGVAACGNANVVTPTDITQNYVHAIAEGNFPGACALLEPHARSALLERAAAHRGCAALLRHCIPDRILILSGDQSQLLYVNVDIQAAGPRAQATLSGLPVARAIRRVALVRRRGRWELTTAGQTVIRCVARLHQDKARGHRPHSRHG
jgi:hypothetical protein